MTSSGYVFDNAWDKERRRIASIEEVFDPGTKRILDFVGLAPGWSVLEAGAGGGSIASWLASRVAPSGRVLATDLDTRFVESLQHPSLEVRRHDVTTDELPEESFDLIHARCLLEHLPARDSVLKRFVAALKPGGVIVLEDVDWIPDTMLPAAKLPVFPRSGARLYSKTWRAMGKLGAMVGIDHEYARRLPHSLASCGLVGVDAESRNHLVRGGSVGADFALLTIEQVRDMMIAGGLLTERDINQGIANISDPEAYWMSATVIAAWGRKPG